jgi:protein phosphatase
MIESYEDIMQVTMKASEIFQSEDSLLSFEPLRRGWLIVGDTHGDFDSSISALSYLDRVDRIIFLGDYVDRGLQQVENAMLLFRKKIENPSKIYLLRGNHETDEMNQSYGFYEEILSRYNERVYGAFQGAFSFMPYAAVIRDSVFMVHGGLPKGLRDYNEIASVDRGELSPRNEIAFQLLWNDPKEGLKGYSPSGRGEGIYYFGEDVLVDFLKSNRFELFVRAHEVFKEGFRWFFQGKLISLFACRYYAGVTPRALWLRLDKHIIVDL